jgi:phosphomannomutase
MAAQVTDLGQRRGAQRTDALIFAAGDADGWARVVVRPSGTEPKVKYYIEVGCPVSGELADARRRAAVLRDQVLASVQDW